MAAYQPTTWRNFIKVRHVLRRLRALGATKVTGSHLPPLPICDPVALDATLGFTTELSVASWLAMLLRTVRAQPQMVSDNLRFVRQAARMLKENRDIVAALQRASAEDGP